MEVPKFLLQKKFLMSSILFVMVFSILFMLVYQPFSSTVWFAFRPLRNFLLMLLFYGCAVGFMAGSKYLLFRLEKKYAMTFAQYIAWMLVECVCIGVIYLLFTGFFFAEQAQFNIELVARASLCVCLIVVIPYVIYVLYAAYKGKVEELGILRMALESRKEQEIAESIVNLKDYQGNQKVSIDREYIYYMVSQDNYVQIFYELDGKMQSYMLRCKTQDLEQQFAGTSLVRCHRSYIVNLQKTAFFKHDKSRASITLSDADATEIPVSKSYFATVSEMLSERGKEGKVKYNCLLEGEDK